MVGHGTLNPIILVRIQVPQLRFMQYSDQEIETLVKKELTKCHAPLSGYLVACALVTDKSVYFGHNYEHENTNIIEHAEYRALMAAKKAESDPRIKRIILAGGGNVRKFKYYIPCFSCAEFMRKYIDTDIEIYLLPIEGDTKDFRITFDELVECYKELPFSMIEAFTTEEIKKELQAKTILQGIDLDFISDLSRLGKLQRVNFYLTGSSSGRGAVSNLVRAKTNRPYRDIDLIAVLGETSFPEIEHEVESMLARHYKTYVKEKRPLLVHQSKPGVVFAKTFYYCGEMGERIVEFAWCSTFKDSFSYSAYQQRNWFHQLS